MQQIFIWGIRIFSFIAILFLFWIFLILYSIFKKKLFQIKYKKNVPDYFPTKKWKFSSPQEQGMNSEKLVKMIEFYQEKHKKDKNIFLDSITIIKNGYIVSDVYFNSLFDGNRKHIINSCTKSVVSALIGIAIDKGYIKSVDTPVIDILNNVIIKNPDERIKNLTIKDLLTMQTGIHSQDSYLYKWEGLLEMQKKKDWTKYILNLPMETNPGTRFDYSNMASFLLSAIISKTTKKDTLSFAKENLFAPLGIKDIKWEKNPKGIYIGWARLWLKPLDMAKIGLLYLQKGRWENKQVISEKWIDESITPHSFPKKYRYVYNKENKIDWMLSGGNFVANNLIRPFADGYGYQWWLDKRGIYAAVGNGGQYIIVDPKENLVVIFTSKLHGEDAFFPIKLFYDYILPSATSKNFSSNNKNTNSKLIGNLNSNSPLKNKSSVDKNFSKEISGKVYELGSNPWEYNHFRIDFSKDKNNAIFSYDIKGKKVEYRVGLDKVKINDLKEDTYTTVGYWVSQDTFVIEYEMIGYFIRGKWELKFDGEKIFIKEIGPTGKYSYSGKIKED